MLKDGIPCYDSGRPRRSSQKTLSLSKKELAVLKKILHQGRLSELADLVDAGEIKTLLKLAGKVETL